MCVYYHNSLHSKVAFFTSNSSVPGRGWVGRPAIMKFCSTSLNKNGLCPIGACVFHNAGSVVPLLCFWFSFGGRRSQLCCHWQVPAVIQGIIHSIVRGITHRIICGIIGLTTAVRRALRLVTDMGGAANEQVTVTVSVEGEAPCCG